MTLISLDKKLWVTTGTRNAKVKQIRDNPKVEFCLYLRKGGKDCYVRIAGVAKIVMDRETKAKIAGHCDFFNKYFESVDDPNYSLIEICPVEIEYLRPGEFQARKIKL